MLVSSHYAVTMLASSTLHMALITITRLSTLRRNVRTVAFVVCNGNVVCCENVRILYAESYV